MDIALHPPIDQEFALGGHIASDGQIFSDGRSLRWARNRNGAWVLGHVDGIRPVPGWARFDGRIVAKSGRRFLCGLEFFLAFFGQSSFLVFDDASVSAAPRENGSAREAFLEKRCCLGFGGFVLLAAFAAGTLVRRPYPAPT